MADPAAPAGGRGGGGCAGGCITCSARRRRGRPLRRAPRQGTPDPLAAIGGRWIRGGTQRDPGVHPFRKPFHELMIGDTLVSAEREVTVEDIERFAELSGDRYYAHMSDSEAARNPLFGGRGAHGYFLILAGAGVFCSP